MLVAPLALGFFGETGQFEAFVVFHLIGVVGNEMLRLAEGGLDAVFHRTVALTVIPFGRSVHGLHQHHGHTLWSRHAIVIVGKPGECQTLQERAHLTCHITKINR